MIIPRKHGKTQFVEEYLKHYGIARKSGRYPWGSGKDPYQGENWFLSQYETLKDEGLNESEIAAKLKMNTTELRNNITWARKEQREFLIKEISSLSQDGMSNVDIGKRLNISEATVRNYKSDKKPHSQLQYEGITKSIEEGVGKTGYLDVGVGVERQLGVSRTKFNAVVNQLVKENGYHIHEIYVKRLSDPSKYTTVKVLSKEPDTQIVTRNSEKIRPLNSWSDDGAETIQNIQPPKMVDLNRIHIRYAEEGGADKDGLIELRRGVSDLDMGVSKYAQVRIGAGENLFLKGMAAYSEDSEFPSGKDIIYNVTKNKGVPIDKVLKVMKDDIDNPFGANIKPLGQRGSLNLVNEEGDWDTWSTKMSSQFLSKQPTSLIKDRLEATHNQLLTEYEEIASLTNPVVKKHLLDAYTDGLDAKAKHLKAQGLPRTKNHVLLPVTDMKPNEIYAPNYKDGEKVVLVRHPHGGIFEIPDLVVNNKNKSARNLLGNTPDAVAIHPSVAHKLSGADFDGDTALVIPNNQGQIKTSRSLKELKNFDPMEYKVDYPTIKDQTKQIQMGVVSNLITDMSIKGASQSELARAVKHSMVVIDSEKHQLDYKQSAKDNGISALRKKYQTRTNPETGKKSQGASTLISRSKSKIDISDPDFKVERYVSEQSTAAEHIYAEYVKNVQSLKNQATKTSQTIKKPAYSKEAAQVYAPEVKTLNAKLNTALLNAPRERQAQLMTNKLYYSNLKPGMDKDDKKKLKTRSLSRARSTVDAKKTSVDITEKEWEAIQARAISSTKLEQILNNTDTDKIKELATPRQLTMTSSKVARAQGLINRGYTYAEVAEALGVSTSAIRDALQ